MHPLGTGARPGAGAGADGGADAGAGPARPLLTRRRYVVLALVTIVLGLAVHVGAREVAVGRSPVAAARDVAGDALWAAMMVWWVSALRPAAAWGRRAAAALAVCWAVEGSQCWRAPALDAVRATPAGRLALGSDFDARDLAAYALGVAVAALLDRALARRRARAH